MCERSKKSLHGLEYISQAVHYGDENEIEVGAAIQRHVAELRAGNSTMIKAVTVERKPMSRR